MENKLVFLTIFILMIGVLVNKKTRELIKQSISNVYKGEE